MNLVPYMQYAIPGSDDRFGPTMKLPVAMSRTERRKVEIAERQKAQAEYQMKRAA